MSGGCDKGGAGFGLCPLALAFLPSLSSSARAPLSLQQQRSGEDVLQQELHESNCCSRILLSAAGLPFLVPNCQLEQHRCFAGSLPVLLLEYTKHSMHTAGLSCCHRLEHVQDLPGAGWAVAANEGHSHA